MLKNRSISTLASIAVASVMFAATPASADTQRQTASRLPASSAVTFKQKLGYWVECRYTGLGQECNYVYATKRKPKT